MGARRTFRPLLLATVSLLALGPSAPALGAVITPPPGGSCSVRTFAGGTVDSAAIVAGRLVTWGGNDSGVLGRGFGASATPGTIASFTGLTTVTSVYLGAISSYAVDGTGHLWAWGNDLAYELGQPGFAASAAPLPVNGPANVVQVGPGASHFMAVTSDGTLWGWGVSLHGELNFTSPFPQTTPMLVAGISGVAKAVAGDGYSVILKADGTVYGGGSNSAGQLGLGAIQSSLFTPIPHLAGIVDVSVGPSGGDPHLVALDGAGNVFVSGSNAHGEIGNGVAPSSIPLLSVVQVQGLSNVTAISTGGGHTLALLSDGTVMAWGANEEGELGNGSLGADYTTPAPVQFPIGTNIVAIAAGLKHSLALDDRGELWGWGDDFFAELGNGLRSAPFVLPRLINVGTVQAPPCLPPPGPAPRSYIPSRDGYGFNNSSPDGGSEFPAPDYDLMKTYYPESASLMYHADGSHSKVGDWFFQNWFSPAFTGGLCYGMATSDTFLFNRSSVHPVVFTRWPGFLADFNGQSLSPPVTTGDQQIQDFIKRYHARMYGALGFNSSIGVWTKYDTLGNITAFNDIAAHVLTAPQVVAFGPKESIAATARFMTLFNNSHAVVAYATEMRPNGVRVIKVFDPSSVMFSTTVVTDLSEIDIFPDGSLQLVDFADARSISTTNPVPVPWIGGGVDSSGRDMGQPNEWVLMPLPDSAFGDQSVLGLDNSRWLITPAEAWLFEHWNLPSQFVPGVPNVPGLPGLPVFRISGPVSGGLGLELTEHSGYNAVETAQRVGAATSLTQSGHLITITQTDSNAIGSSHHLVIDPSATSIALNAVSQAETFNLEIAADFLPAYSRDISMAGVPLNVSQSLNVASDAQISGLTIHFSGAASMTAPTTFEQDGANAGKTTVPMIVPANSLPATVSVFDWNSLATSLIFEVIDAQGTPTGVVLQGNPQELAAQISTDLASLQAIIAGITDQGLRDSLAAKVAAGQDSFTRGQDKSAANSIDALRHEISAQDGKALSSATAAQLRSVSAEALVLLGA